MMLHRMKEFSKPHPQAEIFDASAERADIPLALASRIVVEHVPNEGWPVIPVQPSEIIGRIANLHVAEVDDANGFGDARVV